MNCKLDYVLYTNNIIELNEINIDAYYIPNQLIVFLGNEINIENKTYKRVTPEYEMIINFKEKNCEIKFSENNSCKFDIMTYFKQDSNQLILEYSFDEEIKKLIITMKE